MSKGIPPVSKYMTTMPHTIEPTQALSDAKAWMMSHGVRHLPVRSGGEVVGLLSERDLTFLATFKDIDLKKAKVKDAMTLDVFKVLPETLVTEVVAGMAESKYGSALVCQANGTLVGIFTTIDALRAFSEIFETRLK